MHECENGTNNLCGGVGPNTADCAHCCLPSCTQLATANKWYGSDCQTVANNACGGVGPKTRDCTHCCAVPPPPPDPCTLAKDGPGYYCMKALTGGTSSELVYCSGGKTTSTKSCGGACSVCSGGPDTCGACPGSGGTTVCTPGAITGCGVFMPNMCGQGFDGYCPGKATCDGTGQWGLCSRITGPCAC
jgi:hypothetical protein